MFATTHGAAQTIENARVALMLIAVGIAVFWRAALRILVAIIIIAICAGAFVLLHGVRV